MVTSIESDLGRPQGPQKFYIPYTMGTWPWRRMANPHEAEVELESKAWLRTFSSRMASDPHYEDNIEYTACARLASLAGPFVSTKEQLRIGSDLLYLYFVTDDCFDYLSPPALQELVDVISDVFECPYKPRPAGEHLLGQIFKEFWELTLMTATPLAAKHFRESFPIYLAGNVTHARDRDTNYIPKVEEYFTSRRNDVGGKAAFLIGEVGLNLPDEAYNHHVIIELQNCTLDIITIDNDMASYNKEQAIGDVIWNIVAILMHHFELSIDQAMARACDYHHKIQRRFISLLNDVPLFVPEIDKEVSAYIFHLAHFAQGNHCWNYECNRYFDNVGLEVQRTGWVELYPKITKYRSFCSPPPLK